MVLPMDLTPEPVLEPEDVYAVVKDLDPGWYPAKQLYERYVTQQADAGRGAVAPPVFGRMLARIGCTRRRKVKGGHAVYGWDVPRVLDIVPGIQRTA